MSAPRTNRTAATQPQLDAVLTHLRADAAAALDRLKALLAIPSVSTDPAYKEHILRAADWVAGQLREVGLKTEVRPTKGHPVVLARSDEAGPAARRVLFYGHYDVQPPDPVEDWEFGPFTPTIKSTPDGDALIARGASDDKGQVMCFVEALRAWRAATGKLPVNVTVLIEGEEEMGSANLHGFIAAHKHELAADFALISDTTMWDRQTVAITYALRGLLYFDVQLHHANRDLHSGMYGGVSANPAVILTQVLGRLFDGQQRVTVPGFYDDVAPLDDAERRAWAKLGFDEFTHCLGPIGVKTPFGEAGFSTLERKWARPSCDINGLYGGYGGAGAKTVIPSFAGAKVSFRLAANQDPEKIGPAFEKWLRSHDVHGCTWKITNLGGCRPVKVATDSPYMAAAQRAIEHSSGRPAVLVREGATIPVVADFKSLLGLDSLLIGFGLVGDRIHAPNEKFELANFRLGCRTHATLLAELAK